MTDRTVRTDRAKAKRDKFLEVLRHPMTKPKIGTNRGNAGMGRPKGSPNKTTVILKEAIIAAAEIIGRDGHGKEGLIGYCCLLAEEEPKAFATLLGKVLPTQVAAEDGGLIEARVIIVPAKELIEPPKVRPLVKLPPDRREVPTAPGLRLCAAGAVENRPVQCTS